jgi:hypothetical protein
MIEILESIMALFLKGQLGSKILAGQIRRMLLKTPSMNDLSKLTKEIFGAEEEEYDEEEEEEESFIVE